MPGRGERHEQDRDPRAGPAARRRPGAPGGRGARAGWPAASWPQASGQGRHEECRHASAGSRRASGRGKSATSSSRPFSSGSWPAGKADRGKALSRRPPVPRATRLGRPVRRRCLPGSPGVRPPGRRRRTAPGLGQFALPGVVDPEAHGLIAPLQHRPALGRGPRGKISEPEEDAVLGRGPGEEPPGNGGGGARTRGGAGGWLRSVAAACMIGPAPADRLADQAALGRGVDQAHPVAVDGAEQHDQPGELEEGLALGLGAGAEAQRGVSSKTTRSVTSRSSTNFFR